ncbi:MAG: hypothetical protein ABW215_23935 [Kibdelosporangium sp.]
MAEPRTYPCGWDQNERLTSASRGVKTRDKVAKAWRFKDDSLLPDLVAAWWSIIARHLSLRVAFREFEPGFFEQSVLPLDAVEPWLVVLDDPSAGQLATLRSHVGLHTGQLFLIALVNRPVGMEMYFIADHICVDSRSLHVIYAELAEYLGSGEARPRETDDLFLRECLADPPSPRAVRPAETSGFAPYAEPPLSFRTGRGKYALEATRIRLPWTAFSFDARAVAPGLGPALLVNGLDALHGEVPGRPGDYPVVGTLNNRKTYAYERAVGPFASWFMLSVPAGSADNLLVRSRRVYGRLLNAMRRPPPPFALETAIRVPELFEARNWPYHQAPRYLYANHLQPTPQLVLGGEVGDPIPLETDLRGYSAARVLSRAHDDGLDLLFTARTDLLAPGVTERLARYAQETVQEVVQS